MGKIGDYARFQNGFAFKSNAFCSDGAFKVIKIKELKDGKIKFNNDTVYVNYMDGIDKYIVKDGDILFALTGDPVSKPNPLSWVGRVSLYRGTEKAVINQRVCKLIPQQNIDPLYLYYFFRDENVFFELAGKATGSASQANISTKTIEDTEIELPDLEYQKKVVKILSLLDTKIEINNLINGNLEEQAIATFKSWFIDFEPYSNHLPSNWKKYILKEFIPVLTGKKNANISSNMGTYPFFSCSQDISWTDNFSFEGDAILVAGNGDFNVKFYSGKFEAYQRTYVLLPYDTRFTAWLFYAIKYNLNNITLSARGSVIKFITKGNLENFSFYAPKDLDNFPIIDFFTSINSQIAINKAESMKLAKLRDTLLPRLMSGELDVSAVPY